MLLQLVRQFGVEHTFFAFFVHDTKLRMGDFLPRRAMPNHFAYFFARRAGNGCALDAQFHSVLFRCNRLNTDRVALLADEGDFLARLSLRDS